MNESPYHFHYDIEGTSIFWYTAVLKIFHFWGDPFRLSIVVDLLLIFINFLLLASYARNKIGTPSQKKKENCDVTASSVIVGYTYRMVAYFTAVKHIIQTNLDNCGIWNQFFVNQKTPQIETTVPF